MFFGNKIILRKCRFIIENVTFHPIYIYTKYLAYKLKLANKHQFSWCLIQWQVFYSKLDFRDTSSQVLRKATCLQSAINTSEVLLKNYSKFAVKTVNCENVYFTITNQYY